MKNIHFRYFLLVLLLGVSMFGKTQTSFYYSNNQKQSLINNEKSKFIIVSNQVLDSSGLVSVLNDTNIIIEYFGLDSIMPHVVLRDNFTSNFK